jgi:heptosyltransferase II
MHFAGDRRRGSILGHNLPRRESANERGGFVKILVRAPNWVGDAVMAIPALDAIRARWPDAEIAVLGIPPIAGLLGGQSFADGTIAFERGGRHGGFWGRERMAVELAREQFDVAILLPNSFEAAWIAWRADIATRIGYAHDGRGILLTNAVARPRAGEIPAHHSYYYLELLRRAGWIEKLPANLAAMLRVSAEAKAMAELALLRAGARAQTLRCAVAPGAAFGTAKRWLPERYGDLAKRLRADWDADVVLVGTAGDRAVADAIAARAEGDVINMAGKTSAAELPAMLAACDVFIGNDSGASYVAAAVGLPVIAIYGPMPPEIAYPITPRLEIVRHAVSCSPCLLRDCPVDHRCMTRIEVEDVVIAARKWLNERAPEAGSVIGG